ncbi:MAG: ATP-grasp domain-containing protein [Candidatus Nanoarchaeia archaeon]|nr:ATP-grasp domain-containing protein [Candidatus Nanoarchaeia archaeon]
MNVLVLCSPRFNNGTVEERFWPVDKIIISEIKKTGHGATAVLFDKSKPLQLEGYDVAFNLCDGFEDIRDEPIVPSMLASAKIPFTGNTAEIMELSSSKLLIKERLIENGVPTPDFQLFETGDEDLKITVSSESQWIIKPTIGHASSGIEIENVVNTEEKLRKRIKEVIEECKCPVIVEKYIEGREFYIPLIGNKEPIALPFLEIDYSTYEKDLPKILSYKAKWSKNSNVFKNTDSMVVENIDPKLKKKIEGIGKGVYKAIGCAGYASVDVRVDKDNNVYVIDLNPNCYIADDSDFVKSANLMGMSYVSLLNKLIEFAIERK